MPRFSRVFLIVMDSVGIGELPDAPRFQDEGAHTLGHIAERVEGFALPHLQALGLGNIAPLANVPAAQQQKPIMGK